MVKPSCRREMAKMAQKNHGISIGLVCETFSISETCYRYQPRLMDENNKIADWLMKLTGAYRNWGFSLCFLHLRNVKGFLWNHKRVYRIYRELELNLRIKPKKRIIREKPEPLRVPTAIKESKIKVHPGTEILADSGYQGLQKLHIKTRTPTKRIKKVPLKANSQLASERVPNENIIAMVKRFKIVSDRYRNRRKRFGLRFNLIAGLYNWELSML